MKQLSILAIILIVLTLVVLMVNPTMRQEIRIVNSEYKIQEKQVITPETNKTTVQNQEVVKNRPVQVNNVEPVVVQQNVNVTNTQIPEKKVQTVQTPVKPQQVQVKTTTKQVTTAPKTVQQKPQTTVSTTKPVAQPVAQKPTVQPVQPSQPAKPVATTQPAKPAVTTQAKPAPTKTPEQIKKEKEAQEAVSWNKWRANVYNQIIAQVNLPASVPDGTEFRFSFTVTSDGTVSNIKTSSVAPQYTAFAIQYIAPVIRRSAHAAFLKYPAGTERTVVDVSAKFKVTNGNAVQASANKFNDIEVIKR